MAEGQKRILIVEDDASMRKLQQVILQRSGYTVLEAENGEEALRIISCESVDLILTDVLMPGMSGIDLLRKLREDPVTAKIPVIVCTSDSEPQNVQEALRLGIAGYILKPIVARDLVRKIVKAEKMLEPVLSDPSRTVSQLDLQVSEFQELLYLMIEDGKSRLKEIGKSIEAGDLSQFFSFSRDILTSADNFGAVALHSATLEASTSMTDAKPGMRLKHIFNIRTQLERLRFEVSQL